jgi:hypothetical protein
MTAREESSQPVSISHALRIRKKKVRLEHIEDCRRKIREAAERAASRESTS